MTATSDLRMMCPGCSEEIRYDSWSEDWTGDNYTTCADGTHRVHVEEALVHALSIDGIHGLLRALAGDR
jgi:hypothetical protein